MIDATYTRRMNVAQPITAEAGFALQRDPDTVRAPDVALVASHRLAEHGERGFARIASDLVVEVLSPDDRSGEVLQKVGDWLVAGTRLVWVIDPERRTGLVHRADGTIAQLATGDALDGEGGLPGLCCQLTSVL
jgi:Uma2 family endonuclease